MSTGCIKRKARRRSIWERGIIRKKKSSKKEEVEDDDEPEEEEGADDSTVVDPGNASPAQDESSSDTTEQTDKPLPQPNGYALSTEEENSSEATATQDPQGQEGANTASFNNPPSEEEKAASLHSEPQECVNGDESMDSIDSEANDKEIESSRKEVTASLGGGEQAGLEDALQECKANDCTPLGDGAASDGVHEKEGTGLSTQTIYASAYLSYYSFICK